jgi:hypothetical protein
MRIRTALGVLATAPLLAMLLPAAPAAADDGRTCQGVSPVVTMCPITGRIDSLDIVLNAGCLMPAGSHLTITVTTSTLTWTVGVTCNGLGRPYYSSDTWSGYLIVGQTYTLDVVATGTGYFEATVAS